MGKLDKDTKGMWRVINKIGVEQRKTILLSIGSYLGFILLLGIWSGGWLGLRVGMNDAGMYAVISWIMCVVVASMMFGDFKKKEDRLSTLMTPATAWQKFLPRLLTAVPGTLILATLGWYVYEYSKIISFGINEGIWQACPHPIEAIFEDGWESIIAIGSYFLFIQSIFFLGGVAWPKKSFIKTLGLLAIFGLMLSVILGLLTKIQWQFIIIQKSAIVWTLIVFTLILSVCIFYLAYRKLKRMNVVK